MAGCSDEAIAAAESLGLPVARRSYTHNGAFDTSFVEEEEELEDDSDEESEEGDDDKPEDF